MMMMINNNNKIIMIMMMKKKKKKKKREWLIELPFNCFLFLHIFVSMQQDRGKWNQKKIVYVTVPWAWWFVSGR